MVLYVTIALFCWGSQERSLQACTARRSVPFKAWNNCKERFSMVPDELIEENFAGIPPLL
jgi:hypothetical protein